MSSFSSGQAAKFAFGTEYTFQFGFGENLQAFGYHGIDLMGGMQSTTPPAFVSGTGGTYNTRVLLAGNSQATIGLVVEGHTGQTGDLQQWQNSAGAVLAKVDASGTVTSPQYMGPSSAPSGACSTNGAWVFSQDGHATFCAAGTWVTKL
jgi:hypothetical protein